MLFGPSRANSTMNRRYLALALAVYVSVPGFAYIGDPSLFAPQYHHYLAVFIVLWAAFSLAFAWLIAQFVWALRFLGGNAEEAT